MFPYLFTVLPVFVGEFSFKTILSLNMIVVGLLHKVVIVLCIRAKLNNQNGGFCNLIAGDLLLPEEAGVPDLVRS